MTFALVLLVLAFAMLQQHVLLLLFVPNVYMVLLELLQLLDIFEVVTQPSSPFDKALLQEAFLVTYSSS